MLGSRLFHTVVIVGASLVAGAGIGCSGDDGAPTTIASSSTGTDPRSTDPAPDGGDPDGGSNPSADAGKDPGWAPTK